MAKRRRHRGEGSIRERTPGVWQVRLSHNGRLLTRTVHGTRRNATAALAKLQTEADRLAAKPAEVAGYTVADLIAAWWNSPTVAAAGTKKTPTTLRTHDAMIRNWIGPELGHIRLARLTARDIEKMVVAQQAKGLKASSIRRCLATLRLMLRQAVRWDWLDVNPLDRATIDPDHRGHVTPPPTDAVLAVINAAAEIPGPHRDTLPVLLYLLAVSGIRRGEACGLQWADINWRDGQIHVVRNVTYTPRTGLHVGVPKNKKGRVVPLEPGQMDHLLGLYQQRAPVPPTHWVFGPDGGARPLTPAALSAAYHKARDRAGTRLRLHDFRHWHATRLLDMGIPIKTVQERLGHAHASTTLNIYAHPVEETARVAARAVSQMMAELTTGESATPDPRPLPPAPTVDDDED